jgi:hypothetical protein
MQIHSRLSHLATPSAAALMLAFSMAGTPAQAVTLSLDTPPPELLDYASATPTRESRAGAWSTYQGSLRGTPCDDSGAFWACRNLINSADAINPANRAEAMANDGSVVSAARTTSAFDYVQSTDLMNFNHFADITPATSNAKAKTDFGSNKAEAAAWNGRVWTETRVTSAWDATQSSITGVTHAGAYAWSTYTEVFTPDKDGQIILNFDLTQHAGSGVPISSTGFDHTKYDGDAWGDLLVQVFNLDQMTEYWKKDSAFPIEGFAIVANDGVGRSWDEGSGSSFLSIAFDVVADNRYSLVSQLQVYAEDNASADFYGTASLKSILVTPGMNLAVGSGTTYAVAAVPEPETYALLLAGLGLVGFAARRRG